MFVKVIPVFLEGLVGSDTIFKPTFWVTLRYSMMNQINLFLNVWLPIVAKRLNHSFFCISIFKIQLGSFSFRFCNLLFSKLINQGQIILQIIRRKSAGHFSNVNYFRLTFYHTVIINSIAILENMCTSKFPFICAFPGGLTEIYFAIFRPLISPAKFKTIIRLLFALIL